MGIIKQRDFPGWVSGENGSLRGPRRRKAPRVSITRQLGTDGKSRTYGFETPLRHFLLKVPFTRSLYLSPLRQKIRPFEVVPEIVSFSRSHFQFCSNKTSSMKMREQSGKGGFLSKIQFNARKSSIYFPIHGQNGIAQSLASMPQPTRQFYISPLAFSPIRIIHGSTI